MIYWLKRHPFPVVAYFRHTLVLTYGLPIECLENQVPPGLTLDTHRGLGFLAIALVQTEALRPATWPRALGRNFFLAGYRIFTRFRDPGGRTYRGLRILRSDTDRRIMKFAGNLLTHYNYRRCRVRWAESGGALEVRVDTPGGLADLEVVADLRSRPAPLPPRSPFTSAREARRFAGPLPYTFDYEKQTHSIVVIRATRQEWEPQPVSVDVRRVGFLDAGPFRGVPAVLANAFHVSDVPYRWERGVRYPLPASPQPGEVGPAAVPS